MARDGLRLLVKKRAGGAGRFTIAGASAPLDFEPLLPNIEGPAQRQAMAARAVWHIATTPAQNVNPWDACHALLSDGLGLASGGVTFAEPDLAQQWLWETKDRLALGITANCQSSAQKNGTYPVRGNENYWHMSDAFSQLLAARGSTPAGGGVRIAHLDTGYDPGHDTKPAHFRTDLQKNFADEDRPDDATDRPTAAVNPMFGHGTGTLSLLAGRAGDQIIGAACDLEVVPIRVANWVVLFENSAIAQALDYVYSLRNDPRTRIDVVTMSMGGLPSAAWADAVNALYDAGVFIVTAAGNNFGNLPTRYIVYPARFQRVTAACGVMSNGRPYADLPISAMAGCYGPDRKMLTALSAYTPNVPWAKFGCPQTIDYDGGGTSAATPQIAAAAALWIKKNKAALDRIPADKAWLKVEAVRKALFSSARKGDEVHLGVGSLRALDALAVAVARESDVSKTAPDSVSFPLLRTLTGLGVSKDAPIDDRQRMLELEALQLSQQSRDIENLLGGLDPQEPGAQTRMLARPLLEALADHPRASQALKQMIARSLTGSAPPPPPEKKSANRKTPVAPPPLSYRKPELPVAAGGKSELPKPPARRLRVFAFDPILRTRLETLSFNETTLNVRWENNLAPGPIGEYLEVVDIDPPSGRAYAPVDLNAPALLAQDGLAPTEGNPQFHQQMVYAVAMKTIEHFERALGRVALWAERRAVIDGQFDFRFVKRLRIYPHALAECNAYYSPEKRALLFGYFPASKGDAGDNLPGGLIFSCLSHDIVAHETTHALLDGLHPHYQEATNVDMLAFHEAFADIVALFQHFTLADALRDQIRKSRGDLSLAALLGGLALQFGQAIGNRGVLRSAIARRDETGAWVRVQPGPGDYEASSEPHERGSVLVAAVFDAFLQIYVRKTEDLVRLATGGSGILPAGQLPFDLVERLAREASRIAGRVLTICIRALDYCPPFDLTFGEYLRALITADRDLVPDDEGAYRVAFISAFRARGIYPDSVRNLSVEGLAWDKPHNFSVSSLGDLFRGLSLNWKLNSDRYAAFMSANADAKTMYETILASIDANIAETHLGIVLTKKERSLAIDGRKGRISRPMLTVRPSRRVGPSGEILANAVIEITQRWKPLDGGPFHRGGCTIIADLENGEVQYVIGKRLRDSNRIARQRQAALTLQEQSLYSNYYDDLNVVKEPFAMLHRHL